jgi:hypothetical protein
MTIPTTSSFNSINGLQGNIQFKKLQYTHERTLNQQNNAHELEMQQKQFEHEDKQKAQDLGTLGRYFGGGEHSSRNITAVICLVLIVGAALVSGVIYWQTQDKSLIASIWNKVIPLIALSLGYIFGKK